MSLLPGKFQQFCLQLHCGRRESLESRSKRLMSGHEIMPKQYQLCPDSSAANGKMQK